MLAYYYQYFQLLAYTVKSIYYKNYSIKISKSQSQTLQKMQQADYPNLLLNLQQANQSLTNLKKKYMILQTVGDKKILEEKNQMMSKKMAIQRERSEGLERENQRIREEINTIKKEYEGKILEIQQQIQDKERKIWGIQENVANYTDGSKGIQGLKRIMIQMEIQAKYTDQLQKKDKKLKQCQSQIQSLQSQLALQSQKHTLKIGSLSQSLEQAQAEILRLTLHNPLQILQLQQTRSKSPTFTSQQSMLKQLRRELDCARSIIETKDKELQQLLAQKNKILRQSLEQRTLFQQNKSQSMKQLAEYKNNLDNKIFQQSRQESRIQSQKVHGLQLELKNTKGKLAQLEEELSRKQNKIEQIKIQHKEYLMEMENRIGKIRSQKSHLEQLKQREQREKIRLQDIVRQLKKDVRIQRDRYDNVISNYSNKNIQQQNQFASSNRYSNSQNVDNRTEQRSNYRSDNRTDDRYDQNNTNVNRHQLSTTKNNTSSTDNQATQSSTNKNTKIDNITDTNTNATNERNTKAQNNTNTNITKKNIINQQNIIQQRNIKNIKKIYNEQNDQDVDRRNRTRARNNGKGETNGRAKENRNGKEKLNDGYVSDSQQDQNQINKQGNQATNRNNQDVDQDADRNIHDLLDDGKKGRGLIQHLKIQKQREKVRDIARKYIELQKKYNKCKSKLDQANQKVLQLLRQKISMVSPPKTINEGIFFNSHGKLDPETSLDINAKKLGSLTSQHFYRSSSPKHNKFYEKSLSFKSKSKNKPSNLRCINHQHGEQDGNHEPQY